ncbi:XRCC4-like factor-domain-containing protein [Phaeosphaeriaceae sp. PMI808]|nr:XRCC4-like factor-domain-containing protein [Phaeosphaeriaceae sp. PMI808]
MSCWRVLELSEQLDDQEIPQLLVKPVFRSNSYTVHVTCLSNIWSEELDLHGIVDRALKEQSPIEVSKRDTAQLAILLDNVKRSLEVSEDAICRITRHGTDGIILHTTINLPKPLDSLIWKFYLVRRASTTLKNELILPLLISSHIQHARITALISTIHSKDKVITRLVDQYESSNLDLAEAFPIIGGMKTGRRLVKREQAARHVPALQPFREDVFKQETGQLSKSNVSTLGLFQEALSECTPEVPPQLKSDGLDLGWWTGIPDRLSQWKPPVRSKEKEPTPLTKSSKTILDSSDVETEDEFEIHENFKTRDMQQTVSKVLVPSTTLPQKELITDGEDDTDDTEDEDDLDALPKSRSQTSSQCLRKQPPVKSSTLDTLPKPIKSESPPHTTSEVKGFRIGGISNKTATECPPPTPKKSATTSKLDDALMEEPPSSQMNTDVDATPKKPKKAFKIGGKGRREASDGSHIPEVVDRTKPTDSSLNQTPTPSSAQGKPPVLEEQYEETPEEKAERKRAELKRRTEEAAKKQAQSKKRRRF